MSVEAPLFLLADIDLDAVYCQRRKLPGTGGTITTTDNELTIRVTETEMKLVELLNQSPCETVSYIKIIDYMFRGLALMMEWTILEFTLIDLGKNLCI
jgi:hypothetical protein